MISDDLPHQAMAALAVTEISRNNFANQTSCADNGAIGSLVAQLRLSGARGARDALSRDAISPAVPGTEEVKAEAAGAIWVLSEGHVENKIAIASAGGIAPTVSLPWERLMITGGAVDRTMIAP